MTPLYRSWVSMRRRARHHGISVCPGWENFVSFKGWAEANGYEVGYCLKLSKGSTEFSPSTCGWRVFARRVMPVPLWKQAIQMRGTTSIFELARRECGVQETQSEGSV